MSSPWALSSSSPGSTGGYFINGCSCLRSPSLEGEEAKQGPLLSSLALIPLLQTLFRNGFGNTWREMSSLGKLSASKKTKYHYQSPHNKTVSNKLISYRTLSFHDVASWKSYGCVTVLTLVHVGRAYRCRAEQSAAVTWACCFSRGTSESLLIQHHRSGHYRSFSFTVQRTVPPNAVFVRLMTLPSALQPEPMVYTC